MNSTAIQRTILSISAKPHPCARGLHSPWYRTSSNTAYEGYNTDRIADINYVQAAMKKWVQEYVIDHEFCPFAKQSSYRIAVWPIENLYEQTKSGMYVKEFIKNEVVKLLDTSTTNQTAQSPRPNTFVVFPFVEEFIEDVHQFKQFLSYMTKAIPGAGDRFAFDDPECKIQIFPFHLNQNWRLKTPWPTFHLLRIRDLNEVRRGNDKLSTIIREKNDKTLETDSTVRQLSNILFKLSAFPEPIQMTKGISAEEKAMLTEKGFRVVEPKVNTKKAVESPVVQIKKLPKKRGGKRKPKR